jgi:putative salt-induced outer membrane protein YdiY
VKKPLLLLLAVAMLGAAALIQAQPASTQDNPQAKPIDKPAETAAEKPPQPAKGFIYHSSTSISFLLARGNNKTLSFSFDTDQNFGIKKDSFNLKGTVIYARDNGFMTNEIYYTHLKYNHQLGDGAYLLSLARFERNVLAGYPSRYSFSAGGGWTWIKSSKFALFSDLAVGWSSENSSAKVNLGDVTGPPVEKSLNSSFLSTIFTSRLTFSLTATSQVIHQEVVFVNMADMSDYRVNSMSSLSASFSRYFGLKMTVQVNYERKPVLGYKNTDVFLISSLVIGL